MSKVHLKDLRVGDCYRLDSGEAFKVVKVIQERTVSYQSIDHGPETSQLMMRRDLLVIRRLGSDQDEVQSMETGMVYTNQEEREQPTLVTKI